MFKFGQAYGTVIGVLGALAIPIRYTTPTQWKRVMGLNNDAEASRGRALDLFPGRCELFNRKKDHNRAEAVLLALYGLKNGGV